MRTFKTEELEEEDLDEEEEEEEEEEEASLLLLLAMLLPTASTAASIVGTGGTALVRKTLFKASRRKVSLRSIFAAAVLSTSEPQARSTATIERH